MANTAAHTAVFDLSKRGTTSKPLSFSLRTSILTIGNAMIMSTISRSRFRLSAGAIAVLFFAFAPIGGAITPAQAQVSVSVEFRTALEPYGRWERHARWGEIWIPANRPRDWRPYTVGHWVYTDDWGWYWIEDEEEAAWGLVTYHYGRWVYDDEWRWAWVPAAEWGPGWVQWRRSRDVVGWAPLPPDNIAVEFRERPEVWAFCRPRDFLAPRVAAVVLPAREYPVLIRETVIENRTVIVSNRGPRFAVNPGIPAAFIAASVGRPLRAFEVRPRVLAGTVRFPNAVEVRAQDLRNPQVARSLRTEVRESRTEIRPTASVPNPRPLAPNEQGRLGDNPPRAAQGQFGTQGRGTQPGQAPQTEGQQKQLPQTQGKGGQPQQQLPQTQGKGGQPQQQLPQTQAKSGEPQQQLPQTQGKGGQPQQQLPQTQGKGGQPQQQLPQTQGKGGQPQQQLPQTQGKGGQPKQPPQTEGRGAQPQRPPQAQPRQLPQTEGRGAQPQPPPQAQPRQLPQAQPRQLPQTEGRGAQPQRPPQAQPRQLPQTEGRGAQPQPPPQAQPRQPPQAQPRQP